MKHYGKARKAAFKMILFSLLAVIIILVIGAIAVFVGTAVITIIPILFIIWFVFALFTLYFFRDPTPNVPVGPNLVLSPAYGKVDVIDTTTENQFVGGQCLRVSIFLSVIDVHVQSAPVGGRVSFLKYTQGEFMNAIKTECAQCNENVLLGFEANEPRGVRIGVRLIAGVIARRIVPFVAQGDEVARGERISLIQFGSRADVYLPLGSTIKVQLGQKVRAGETILATLA